jgi:hypothetical protein
MRELWAILSDIFDFIVAALATPEGLVLVQELEAALGLSASPVTSSGASGNNAATVSSPVTASEGRGASAAATPVIRPR